MHFTADVRQLECEHVALVYDGVDDLSRRLAPKLRRASAEGAAVLVCLDELAAARVRTDLGSASDSFVFTPAIARYATPGVAMAALDKFVGDAMSSGASAAWSIGAIPLGDDGRDGRWMRYEEAVANVFADRPLRAVCLYDASTTPPALQHSVGRTHHTMDGCWNNDSAGVVPVSYDLCPARSPDLLLTDAPPRDVRAAVDSLLTDSVSNESLADIRLVVSELTTNALVHGKPPAEVRIWRDGPVCVLQVHDTGAAPIDSYADLRPCTGGAHGGFGLWTVGQLADAVHITHDERGNTVTALLVAH